MINVTTAMSRLRSVGTRALHLRERLARIDAGATAVKAVAAGLVIGTASLLVVDADGHRNTDTRAEVVARIAPVGSVTVAAASPSVQTADAVVSAAASGDS
jgi:hypothetical protein